VVRAGEERGTGAGWGRGGKDHASLVREALGIPNMHARLGNAIASAGPGT
jgi:hypothetical protein